MGLEGAGQGARGKVICARRGEEGYGLEAVGQFKLQMVLGFTELADRFNLRVNFENRLGVPRAEGRDKGDGLPEVLTNLLELNRNAGIGILLVPFRETR